MSLTNSSSVEVARAASIASRTLAVLSTTSRNEALTAIYEALLAAKDTILSANARDVEEATQAAADGRLSQSVLSRLDLSRKGKWEDMLQGVLGVRDLDDPGEYAVSPSALIESNQLYHRSVRSLAPQPISPGMVHLV